ncbi:MAG: NAD(P)-dependent alcohol dehydrogenase [Woeseiaceae bacterium]|nr:NAD(P)-dependent alcohol dehydrogenase [Woeseiaceae bacterium]
MTVATAAVAREPHGDMSLETVELDDLRPGEILVKIDACGICHTDVKYRDIVPLPAVFGHEGTGVVEATGEGVTGLSPGDRVIMSYAFCGECPCCSNNQPYLCENLYPVTFSGKRFDGSATMRLAGEPISGAFFQQSSFASHAITLERTAVRVASEVSPEMLAAIPCGVQTGAGAMINTFSVQRGDSVVVFGAGTVGLSAVMVANMIGASPIICVEVLQNRLELARELGATHVLNASEGDVAARIKQILPRGARYALDASATVAALESAIQCIGQGGRIAIVSFPDGGKQFPFSTKDLFLRVGSLQGTVQGHSVPREFLPRLIEWQREGRFPYEKLISTYAFADINQAFEDAESGLAIKPVLLMPD